MSGTKCSPIRFRQLTAMFLQAQQERETALRDVTALVRRGERLVSQLTTSSVTQQTLAAELSELRQQANAELRQLASQQKDLQAIGITGPQDSRLDSKQRAIAKIIGKVRSSGDAFERITRRSRELQECDAALSAIVAAHRQAEHRIRTHGDLMQQWEPTRFRQLQQDFQSLSQAVTNARQKAGSLAQLQSLEHQFDTLEQKLRALITTSNEQAEQDRQRRLNQLQRLKERCRETLEDIDDLIHNVEGARQSLDQEHIANPAIQQIYDQSRKALEEKSHQLHALHRDLQSITWPSSAADDWMTNTGQTLDAARQTLAGTQKSVDDIAQTGRRFKELDLRLGDQQQRLEELEDRIRNHETLLQRWLPNEYKALATDHRQLVETTDMTVEQIRAPQTPTQLDVRDQAITRLSSTLDDLVQTIAEREAKHQQRMYILKALRGVCGKLGFTEVSKPKFQVRGNHNTPIEQIFDTRNQGQITFSLALDDEIHSESGIHVGTCRDEFVRLSEQLKLQFGIDTNFKRVDDDGKPLRRKSGENDIPSGNGSKGQTDHQMANA